jgi:hypothetical protein
VHYLATSLRIKFTSSSGVHSFAAKKAKSRPALLNAKT